MKPLVILKLGGSVITDKASVAPKADMESLRSLAKEISEAYKKGDFNLVIVHGAGSFGHGIVKETGIDKGLRTREDAMAFAEVQRLQNMLNVIVTQELIKAGLPAIPCQASAHAVMERGRIKTMGTDAVKGLVERGLIPVLYGVPAYDAAQGCSILSGDQIAPYVAKRLDASKIIHGTDVEGIFTADPKKDKNAKLIGLITRDNLEEVKRALGGSDAVDVTGGMLGKVMELVELGIESQIINALAEGNVSQALAGETIGTTIKV